MGVCHDRPGVCHRPPGTGRVVGWLRASLGPIRRLVGLCLVAVLLAAPTLWPARATAQTPATDAAAVRILLRSTLVALNHANITGNYTVLRDLSAPSFAADYSAATLALAFTSLRDRNLDLGPLTVLEPIMAEAPAIVDGGLFRLVGFFPSRPIQINFDLYYQPINGRWRLAGIAVDPFDVPPEPEPAAETE